ncbi:MAG TPA: phosphoenolpyruvate--protein phosphotransferase [Magnetospirillaceae bacterium]|nr:phosphoenolpyruvate--protein phosphotransferase [Magnetospirillaceae bacterium]
MIELTGVPVSPGIAIGSTFLYLEDDDVSIPKYHIRESDIETEWQRFQTAVGKTRDEITDLRDRALSEMGASHSAIFDSHLLMLDDPELMEGLETSLKESLRNIEWIVLQREHEYIERLSRAQDSYLQERVADIRDVAKRILNHLMFRERFRLSDLGIEVVLVAHNLLPSDIITMNKRMVKGLVLEGGGKTSHAAILARAFEIPAVLGVGGATRRTQNGVRVVVDGRKGRVVIEPDESTLIRYEQARSRAAEMEATLLASGALPVRTLDGRSIQVKANIEIPDEVDAVLRHGADGVGLFRSEFLFLQPGRIPSEDEQCTAYRRVLRSMEGRPVTIRTLDLGGDKALPELSGREEKNPLLGWRAIRLCLSLEDLFLTQLRAILRASPDGDARVMFPMISVPEELDQALALLERAKDQCREAGWAFRADIAVGIMVEVPSAALASDILARRSAFFSIGTNDLIQYTLAVDRGNEKVSYLHQPFQPAVLRLIKTVIDAGKAAGIPVGMCGEMAADPYAALVLLGLGLDEFSMSSVSIPEIKRLLRGADAYAAAALARDVLAMDSAADIESYLRSRIDPEAGVFR